jgi:hypothetical protein
MSYHAQIDLELLALLRLSKYMPGSLEVDNTLIQLLMESLNLFISAHGAYLIEHIEMNEITLISSCRERIPGSVAM